MPEQRKVQQSLSGYFAENVDRKLLQAFFAGIFFRQLVPLCTDCAKTEPKRGLQPPSSPGKPAGRPQNTLRQSWNKQAPLCRIRAQAAFGHRPGRPICPPPSARNRASVRGTLCKSAQGDMPAFLRPDPPCPRVPRPQQEEDGRPWEHMRRRQGKRRHKGQSRATSSVAEGTKKACCRTVSLLSPGRAPLMASRLVSDWDDVVSGFVPFWRAQVLEPVPVHRAASVRLPR